MRAKGRSIEMTAATKITRVHGQPPFTSAMKVRVGLRIWRCYAHRTTGRGALVAAVRPEQRGRLGRREANRFFPRRRLARSPASILFSSSRSSFRNRVKYFKLIRSGIDVAPLLEEVRSQEQAWLLNTSRQDKIRVQRDTNTIFLSGPVHRPDLNVNENQESSLTSVCGIVSESPGLHDRLREGDELLSCRAPPSCA